MAIEWDNLTDEGFENLCYDVLAVEGYKNLEWVGRKGGDRGRDILATKLMKMTETHEMMFHCVIQCKRYLARRPAPSDLDETLVWADAHNPDVLLIMIPSTLTADTHDWLDKIRPRSRYRILIYDEKHFEQFFDRNREVHVKHFGKERVLPRKLILSSLLQGADQTVQTISSNAQVSTDNVITILHDLEQQKIVSHGGPETGPVYRLERDLITFTNLAKELLADETGKFEFVSSEYSRSLIGPELIGYIESRYHLVLDADRRVAFAKLFKISPSALSVALFSSTDKYDTVHAHIEELGLRDEERDKWNQSVLTEFVSTLLENALADFRDPHATKTLQKNEVEGYDVGIKMKMVSSKGPVLHLGSELIFVVMKAGETIRAGQLVSPNDPAEFLRIGNILLHLGLLELAIKEYDNAISNLRDRPLDLAGAINNKGVCLMSLRRWNEAISCFDEALEISPDIKEARNSKQKCEGALQGRK